MQSSKKHTTTWSPEEDGCGRHASRPPSPPRGPRDHGAQTTPVVPVLEATLQVSSAAGRFLKDAPGSVPAGQQAPTEGLLSGHGVRPSRPRAPAGGVRTSGWNCCSVREWQYAQLSPLAHRDGSPHSSPCFTLGQGVDLRQGGVRQADGLPARASPGHSGPPSPGQAARGARKASRSPFHFPQSVR